MGGCLHRAATNNAIYAAASNHFNTTMDCEAFYNEHKDFLPYKKDFDRLMLKGYHLSLLFKAFVKIDQDLSGEISTWELLEFLHLERTKFTKRIFRIFDEDGSGQIDFREFCMSLWNYATLGKNQLIMFAFDLYDNDGSGQIDFTEVEMMLKEVYGRGFKGNAHAQKILEKTRNMSEENFTVDSFSVFVQKHPALLFPAFLLQTTIQKLIVGQDFWEECAMTRINLSNGQYVTISQILKAHVSSSAFEALVVESRVIDSDKSRVDALAKEKVQDILYVSGNISERKFKRSREFTRRHEEEARREARIIASSASSSSSLVADETDETEGGGGNGGDRGMGGALAAGEGGGGKRRRERRSRENSDVRKATGGGGNANARFKKAGVGVMAANRLKKGTRGGGVGVGRGVGLAGETADGGGKRKGSARPRIKSGPMKR